MSSLKKNNQNNQESRKQRAGDWLKSLAKHQEIFDNDKGQLAAEVLEYWSGRSRGPLVSQQSLQ